MHRLLSLPIVAIVFIAHCTAAQVPCTPLADYVDPSYKHNFAMLMAGGDISSDASVIFTVPRIEMSLTDPQVKLCIEDLPIPFSVGGVPCDDWLKCWLIIGRHTDDNINPDDVGYCKSSDPDRGIAPCDCSCSGSYFGSGSVPPESSLTSRCGLYRENAWGASCPDVMDERRTPCWGYDQPCGPGCYSNSSTVQINICDEAADNCNICRVGGYHPSFRVGLRWTNQAEQCYADNPFTSDGMAVNSHNVLTFMVSISAAFATLFLLD